MTQTWSLLGPNELSHVVDIAAVVHPGFFEAADVLAEKQALYPQGARLLRLDGVPSGYILSHPWAANAIPALNAPLGAIPPDADSYYLHDLALLPSARGTGAAGAIVADILAHARGAGFGVASLVAVNGSIGFWRRQGFAVNEVPALLDKLAGYEPAARFMTRPL